MYDPIFVYFHGVCGPENPGGWGGWAFTVKADDKLIGQASGLLDRAPGQTEMTVEHHAIHQALDFLFEHHAQQNHVRFFGSKQILINQLNGIWTVEPAMAERHVILTNKLRKFRDIGFVNITKRQNEETIALAKAEMKKRGAEAPRPSA